MKKIALLILFTIPILLHSEQLFDSNLALQGEYKFKEQPLSLVLKTVVDAYNETADRQILVKYNGDFSDAKVSYQITDGTVGSHLRLIEIVAKVEIEADADILIVFRRVSIHSVRVYYWGLSHALKSSDTQRLDLLYENGDERISMLIIRDRAYLEDTLKSFFDHRVFMFMSKPDDTFSQKFSTLILYEIRTDLGSYFIGVGEEQASFINIDIADSLLGKELLHSLYDLLPKYVYGMTQRTGAQNGSKYQDKSYKK